MGIIDFFYDLYDGKHKKETSNLMLVFAVTSFVAVIGFMLRYAGVDSDELTFSHGWRTVGVWLGLVFLAISVIIFLVVSVEGFGESDRKRSAVTRERIHQEHVAWESELEIEKLRKENAQLKENQCAPTNDPRTQQAPGARRY